MSLVNLDPGYLTTAKLVLATTKDFGHRVYLRDGIYAESTLHYIDGRWEPWPWTYPDYAGPRYHAFFERVRERFKQKLSARDSSTSSDLSARESATSPERKRGVIREPHSGKLNDRAATDRPPQGGRP